ncbi:MAG: phytanoyl-CoA dioxygenase family protein, partial [Deltaproteobacteria bacterium]
MIDYLKEFEDKGFFTCADILNESEREELLSIIDQIERNVLGHPENKKEMDPNNTSRLRKINDLTLNHQYFFEISKKTEILNVIEKCIGPDIKLFGDQLFMKPPGGVEKTSHQDSPYFPISPMNLITCWIALEDVTEENGCMKFIPGSHQLGALPHSEKWMVGNREDMRIPKDLIQDKNEVSICLKAGSA